MNPLILQGIARTICPVLLLFSLALLLRGHDRPGGGFVSGLMAASALTLYVFAYGVEVIARAIGMAPERIAALGLLLALGSGIPGLMMGRPPLVGYWTELPVPGGDHLHVGTPLLFDMGVVLVVLGATLSFVLYLRGKS